MQIRAELCHVDTLRCIVYGLRHGKTAIFKAAHLEKLPAQKTLKKGHSNVCRQDFRPA